MATHTPTSRAILAPSRPRASQIARGFADAEPYSRPARTGIMSFAGPDARECGPWRPVSR